MSGVFFSPAFYLAYWDNCILKNYSSDIILTNVKLKPHREVWIGAILAAAQTKVSGAQHFVGLPDNEPPDVDIVKYSAIKTTKGSRGTNMDRLHIEITRCSIDDGEDLYSQILKKNKPQYSNMILAVYLYGDQKPVDYEPVYKRLENIKIYLDEILVLALVGLTKSTPIPTKTFSVAKVWPSRGETILTSRDEKAFFRHPEVTQITQRGVSTVWKDLGTYELLPPVILNNG